MEQFKHFEHGRSHAQIAICSYDKNCTGDVSVYCCQVMMCESCSVDHYYGDCKQQGKVNLFFDNVGNKLKVLCEEHVNECTHLSADNKFLCQYCLKPGNINETHAKNTIEVEAELIREALINDASEKKNLHQFLKITEENILLTKNKLENLLQTRTQECLSAYNDFLEREGEMLKCKYQSICNEHMKQYLHIDPGYHQNKLSKSNVELALQKEAILDALCKNENILSLNCETVSLSDTFNFQSKHPFGDIEVTLNEELLVNSHPIPTLRDNIKLDSNKNEQKQENEKEMINILSNLVDDYERKLNVITEENSMLKVQIDAKHESKSPSNKNVQTFFDIKIGGTSAGRVIMNLFNDVVPKTCGNFIHLCTHVLHGYKGSKFQFVSRHGGYCVGGNITTDDGSGGNNMFVKLKCENFLKKHDSKGTLSMFNDGGFTHTIFFINTMARPRDDGKHVVIGKVSYESYSVVEKIMATGCKEIIIANCGVL